MSGTWTPEDALRRATELRDSAEAYLLSGLSDTRSSDRRQVVGTLWEALCWTRPYLLACLAACSLAAVALATRFLRDRALVPLVALCLAIYVAASYVSARLAGQPPEALAAPLLASAESAAARALALAGAAPAQPSSFADAVSAYSRLRERLEGLGASYRSWRARQPAASGLVASAALAACAWAAATAGASACTLACVAVVVALAAPGAVLRDAHSGVVPLARGGLERLKAMLGQQKKSAAEAAGNPAEAVTAAAKDILHTLKKKIN
eukprot:m51a1_g1770 hypothetical protein (267) ;mRNA; r:314752-315552